MNPICVSTLLSEPATLTPSIADRSVAPLGAYTVFERGDVQEGGILPIGRDWETPPRWNSIFSVDDCDATVERAVKAGIAVQPEDRKAEGIIGDLLCQWHSGRVQVRAQTQDNRARAQRLARCFGRANLRAQPACQACVRLQPVDRAEMSQVHGADHRLRGRVQQPRPAGRKGNAVCP